MRQGLLLVVLAPSGGGKGTILKEVLARGKKIRFSVSATTRAPRPGEIEGEHYFFIDRPTFEGLIAQNKMLEYAQYCGNYYGTPKEPVEKWLSEGYDVVLEIEVQGGAQVKSLMPDCVSVFITPPSLAVLEQRLRNRGTETEEVLLGRLQTAREELKQAENFDYLVLNDRLEDAVADMQAIIHAEKLKMIRNKKCVERMLNNA